MSDWHLYIVRTVDDRLYTGITTDVERRFAEHSSGTSRAARAIRHRLPLTLCYHAAIGDRSLALRAEYRVKLLRREQKLDLIKEAPDGPALLALLDLPASATRPS